jgi:hypothetical protein
MKLSITVTDDDRTVADVASAPPAAPPAGPTAGQEFDGGAAPAWLMELVEGRGPAAGPSPTSNGEAISAGEALLT